MNYREKYLKYKKKYLDLKGGAFYYDETTPTFLITDNNKIDFVINKRYKFDDITNCYDTLINLITNNTIRIFPDSTVFTTFGVIKSIEKEVYLDKQNKNQTKYGLYIKFSDAGMSDVPITIKPFGGRTFKIHKKKTFDDPSDDPPESSQLITDYFFVKNYF
jgi:hypothetical protein